MKVPLHTIDLKLDLVSGTVVVGVRPTLLVERVYLLLCNDLARSNGVPDPILCEKPSIIGVEEEENNDLYRSCSFTKGMTKKLGHAKPTVSQKLDTGNEITEDLGEPFLFKMLESEANFPL